MIARFPELTSFGTLLTFARLLEETAANAAQHAANHQECSVWREDLERCAARHNKRSREIERIRRERLNEVVLQPIYGMERDRYVPPPDIRSERGDGEMLVRGVVAIETTAATFYEDAASHALNVLSGVERTFKKLARESADLAERLNEKRSRNAR